ncbi:MAG: hypothetical protein ACXIT4_05070 [Erythrobacter sp.]
MTGFVWIDRHGVRHRLSSPAPIEAEMYQLLEEFKILKAKLVQAHSGERQSLRLRISAISMRYKELQKAALDWNQHVEVQNASAAETIASAVRQLQEDAAELLAIARMYDERMSLQDGCRGDPEQLRAKMNEPMSVAQKAVIPLGLLEPKPAEGATRREAYNWVEKDPILRREPETGAGWFAWEGLNGSKNRINSSLPIEISIYRRFQDLQRLRPTLLAQTSPGTISPVLQEARSHYNAILRLRGDLERFARESAERAEREWKEFESREI